MEDAPQRLLLASGNVGKLVELQALCQDVALEVLGPRQWTAQGGAALPEVEETGGTFLANALLKAASACRATGLSTVADDSGLCVAALGGEPGVHSARFEGPEATDASNRALLLERMQDVADGQRQAAFQCVLVVCGPLAEGPDAGRTEDGLAWRAFSGSVHGTILRAEQGSGGFGYDSLFFCPSLGRTFAEAEAADKNLLSHRGHAFARFATWLAASRAMAAAKKPLFLRRSGLEGLARALDLTLGQNLRYADHALENALAEQPNLGPKERSAVADMHWHALRGLSQLALARLALRGTTAPDSPPDPRKLERRDAPLLACLTLAQLDTFGQPRDALRKDGPPSALDGLAERSRDLDNQLQVPRRDLATALRAAAYAGRAWRAPEQLALELGYSPAFVRACLDELGEEHTRAALTYMNRRGPLTVRANTLRASRDQVAQALQEAGVATVPIDGLPDALLCLESARLTALDAYQQGWFEVQDEGSQRIAAMLAVQPGETVLDWCAGAGGKALALAAAMQGRGDLVALDTHEKRLAECERRLARAGVGFARTRLLLHSDQPMPGLKAADAVLVDAPCSSSGALRRNPELRWHLDDAWLGRFPEQQSTILRRAALHVRPGGRLCYATCSVLRRENEEVVRAFLVERPDFAITAEQRFGPADAAFLSLKPLAQTGPDGFYCCALQRTVA